MSKAVIILTLLLIGCNNNDTCLPSMKIIHGELRSTSFSFQNKFTKDTNTDTPNILKLRKKYNCFSKLAPKYYAVINDYTVIIFSENNTNGVLIILNNEIEKLIKINDFSNYQFEGVSLENETLSIFLKYNKMKQKINFKIKNDYVFWNEYEF